MDQHSPYFADYLKTQPREFWTKCALDEVLLPRNDIEYGLILDSHNFKLKGKKMFYFFFRFQALFWYSFSHSYLFFILSCVLYSQTGGNIMIQHLYV